MALDSELGRHGTLAPLKPSQGPRILHSLQYHPHARKPSATCSVRRTNTVYLFILLRHDIHAPSPIKSPRRRLQSESMFAEHRRSSFHTPCRKQPTLPRPNKAPPTANFTMPAPAASRTRYDQSLTYPYLCPQCQCRNLRSGTCQVSASSRGSWDIGLASSSFTIDSPALCTE